MLPSPMVIDLLNMLQAGNQLKRTPRTGWLMRGIPEAENVASHSFGVAYAAMILAPHLAEPVDIGRLLSLALLHDLPEAITTDIPSPVWRRLPAELKPQAEGAALADIFAGTANAAHIDQLWTELQANETVEARLVHEIDKLEMFLQAHQYEMQYGNRQLSEFWATARRFSFPLIQQLYEALHASRRTP